jgi:hypothetical protein
MVILFLNSIEIAEDPTAENNIDDRVDPGFIPVIANYPNGIRLSDRN